jgi:hypothetical protein
MTDPNFIILYVDNPSVSADFYAGLLGKTPVESSPTFAMFILESGLKLGLWSKHTVEPASAAAGGGGGRWRRRTRVPGEHHRHRAQRVRRLGQARPGNHPASDRNGFWLYLRRAGPRRSSSARFYAVRAIRRQHTTSAFQADGRRLPPSRRRYCFGR